VFFENSNLIGDVMICVFGRSAVDRGSESRSSTTKTGRHDIAEILLKVALNTKHQIVIALVH
jgi:hypothetical protein